MRTWLLRAASGWLRRGARRRAAARPAPKASGAAARSARWRRRGPRACLGQAGDAFGGGIPSQLGTGADGDAAEQERLDDRLLELEVGARRGAAANSVEPLAISAGRLGQIV